MQIHNSLIACPKCDILAQLPSMAEGQKLVCCRCGTCILSRKINSVDRTLALAVAGLLFALPAIFLPIVGIGVVGLFNQASLADSIFILIENGYWFIAFCIFLFTIAIPIIKLCSASYICFSIKFNRARPPMLKYFRSYHHLDSWTMLHVFVLGVVVSMYKLVEMADLTIGYGFIAFVFFQLCSTLVTVTLDHHYIWHKLEQTLEHKK